jgi:hypothetical protein
MGSTADELRVQWSNPSDILSLLLLIGSDIVQKAIAQLIGYKIYLPGKEGLGLSIAPVAFSFGWVAYGFSNLLSAVGERTLMPTTDCPSIVVTCSNGFFRETRPWALGRLLRDHEAKFEVDPKPQKEGGRAESLRVDIFELGRTSSPSRDFAWWLGWATIAAQIGIAIPPWVLYDDWGIMMITLSGNLLAAITCALPQWVEEKWAGRTLEADKVTCLTRGNGHLHIMVFVGGKGSWDLETLATGISVPRPETRWISLGLAILWTFLLISVSGLKEHAWFLVSIGGIGMLQNVFAAGTYRKPSASNFHITKFSRAPTIIGKRERYEDDEDANVNLDQDLENLADISRWAPKKSKTMSSLLQDPSLPPPEATTMPRWLSSMSKDDGVPDWLEPIKPAHIDAATDSGQSLSESHKLTTRMCFGPRDIEKDDVIYASNVHGALMELEKWVPTAGLAMVQIFFPAGLKYEDGSIRDNVHKKFWQKAYCTKSVRKSAEEKRREEERKIQKEEENRRKRKKSGKNIPSSHVEV